MADKNTADIGFEKQIWNAACVLRGNMDASEYKNVVLGLIFLKYISDRFDDKYQELVEEGDGFEEDIDEYTSEGIFFVPAGARWSEIAAKAHTPEIGTVIDDAMRAIEKENKRLKDILPKNFARPELDKGDKERIVYFDARTKIHLQNYIDSRMDDNPALFVTLCSPHERIKIGGIESRLREMGKQLDIQKVHPHKFRRTLATMAIDKGMPIEQLQQLLGHKRIDTTLQYAMVKQSNVKLAHKKYIG